jgi:hypothetical protein
MTLRLKKTETVTCNEEDLLSVNIEITIRRENLARCWILLQCVG